jgi:hypothetical protein
VNEKMKNSNPSRHYQFRLNLHNTRITQCRQGKRVGEISRYVVCSSGVDHAGWNERKPDFIAGIEDLKRAIVVIENSSVRVCNRIVLGNGEADSAVNDREGLKLNGIDGDFWIFRFENSGVYYEDDNGEEN